MKYNRVMFFSVSALLVSLIARFVQLKFICEEATGFFKPEFQGVGNTLLFVIFIFAVITVVFAAISHRSPEHPPKASVPLCVASFLAAGGVLSALLGSHTSATGLSFQITYLNISGFAAAAFFVLFGLKKVANFEIPKVFYCIPVIYMICRISYDFSLISSLAVISDNIIILAAHCSGAYYFMQFAKLYIGEDTELNFRKLLASGLAMVIFSFTATLPNLFLYILQGSAYLHITVTEAISIFATGLFSLVFILCHFAKSNMTDVEN